MNIRRIRTVLVEGIGEEVEGSAKMLNKTHTEAENNK